MFKVTIKEITTKKVVNKEYEKIADTGNSEDGKSIYGYVDKEEEVRDERTVLEQEVKEIDIGEVIKAINDIE